MSKIYKNDTGEKFLFFTNYKVMNSFLAKALPEYFPGIEVFTSIDKVIESDGYIKLAIVRNPYDRFLSLFFDKCREHPKRVKNRDHKVFLQTSQAQILSAAAHLFNRQTLIVEPGKEIDKSTYLYDRFLDNLSVLESLEFPDFVDIAEYLSGLPSMDAHFHPQAKIMLRNGSLIIDKYFRLENIDEYWEEICRMTGREMLLTGVANRTNFEGPDKYKRFYSPEMQKKIFNLYRIDFEYFNYPNSF